MDDFTDGVIGRPANSTPEPVEDLEEVVLEAADSRGLVTVTAIRGRIDTVTVQPRGFDQPNLLGDAMAEATNSILAQLDEHRETIKSAPDLVKLYHQVHAQNQASQRQFDQAIETINEVQNRLDSQIGGLHAMRERVERPGQG